MKLEKRINAFAKLGQFLQQFHTGEKNTELKGVNQKFFERFEEVIARQKALNGWFDRTNVMHAIAGVSALLDQESLNAWLSSYDLKHIEPKKVGIVMAGNIPLVGFHDFLCVLIAGHQARIKLSSDDNTLMPIVAEILMDLDAEFEDRIVFVEKLESIDGVIATGSNNTARYFEHYFGKYPNIIRKNRNSVAVLQGDETQEELEMLADDVFKYYGLGCRNVSKLYVPKDYDFDGLFTAFYGRYQEVIYNNKYANNYDYNKAIYLMGREKLLDNNLVLIREDEQLASPVGVLHYEVYEGMNELDSKLAMLSDEIQCVVSSQRTPIESLRFGKAQSPGLEDYADNLDTMSFLIQLT